MTAERRLSPRYPLIFPVEVHIDSQNQPLDFKTSSVNLSISSIEICCDNALIDHLLAQDKYPHTCQLSFKIPDQDNLFKLESQVVSHRRLSQNSYYLVLIFPDLSVEESGLLLEYLSLLQAGDYNQALSVS